MTKLKGIVRMRETDRPSTPGLIGDAIRQASDLVAAELQLVRFEATEKLTRVVVSIVSLATASIFVIVALIFLLQGLVELLVHYGWAPFAASFAVGGGIAVIALVAILLAVRNLSAAKQKPSRAIRQIQETTDMVRSAR